MNLINLEKVVKAYGPAVLLDEVSLGLAAGDRVGVVGRNGGGKSTLVRLLAGLTQPDSGRVTHLRGLRVGHLSQGDELDPGATVSGLVVGDRPEHEWAADARARDVVAGLLGGIDLDAPVGRLSGGERRRVALARLLLVVHDVLVLDEPTNHLDIDAIDWLARRLRERPEALVVVTHDRWFLDTVCDRTWEVTGPPWGVRGSPARQGAARGAGAGSPGGRVLQYDGGYSAYVLARAERLRLAEAAQRRRRNLLRKELAWLRRGPQARTSKPRFRVEAANALIADEPPPRDTVRLTAFATARLGRTVLELEEVSLRRGSRTLFDRLTWRLGPGERVGLVGANGTGKTTLLRLLEGSVQPDAGHVVRGRTVVPALLDQEPVELDPALRVLEAVERVRRHTRVGGAEFSASQLLERLGFAGERQWTPVGDLSGGERRRLVLLRLLMTEPNVLLLDEPTNDLDIDVLTELEDLLDGWPGTLVVVSHDRYFLERVCDHVVALLDDGTLADLPGGVEDYLDRRRSGRAGGPPAAARAVPGGGRDRPEPGAAAARRAARKEMERLERLVDRLAGQERELREQLTEHATDHQRLAELWDRLGQVQRDRERAEDGWLRLAEETS